MAYFLRWGEVQKGGKLRKWGENWPDWDLNPRPLDSAQML